METRVTPQSSTSPDKLEEALCSGLKGPEDERLARRRSGKTSLSYGSN